MNKKVKAKWVAALRSGEYTQGKGQLKRKLHGTTEHCCLGVLCELYTKRMQKAVLNHAIAFLPTEVMEWAQVGSIVGGKVTIDGSHEALSSHNDGSGTEAKTFLQIADAIEEQL